jgi:hypothetical protein
MDTIKLQEDDAKELGHYKILELIVISLQDSEAEDESEDHNDSAGEVITMTSAVSCSSRLKSHIIRTVCVGILFVHSYEIVQFDFCVVRSVVSLLMLLLRTCVE